MDKVTMKIGEYSSVNRLDDCERRLDCHTNRILDLDDRVTFMGKMVVMCLAFSILALALAVAM